MAIQDIPRHLVDINGNPIGTVSFGGAIYLGVNDSEVVDLLEAILLELRKLNQSREE